MSRVNLSFIEGNDPDVTFTLQKKAADGTLTVVDLTGATVELYIKTDVRKTDADATTVKYSTSTTPTRIAIQSPATAGKVDVFFLSVDIGGAGEKSYRLDVIKNSRRQTYAHGKLTKENV